MFGRLSRYRHRGIWVLACGIWAVGIVGMQALARYGHDHHWRVLMSIGANAIVAMVVISVIQLLLKRRRAGPS